MIRFLERARLFALFAVVLVVFGLLPGASLVAVAWEEPTNEPQPLDLPDAERPGTARVRVLDLEGNALRGAIVRALVVRDGVVHLAARAAAGEDGAAALDKLPIGPHWILADAPGRARASTQRFVGPDPVVLELRLAPERAITIEVKDELGRPIVGAEVEVRGVEPLPKGARTTKDGVARPSGVGPGPLEVSARASGFDAASVRVGADATKAKVVLRRLGAMTVAVVDREGRGVEGATVTIAGGMLAVPRTTTTDATGTARIVGLGAGSYDLRATKGMLVSPIEIGVALARGADVSARLVLGPGRSVRVRVVDEDARPVAKAEVVLAEGGLSPFPFQGTTDASGAVAFGPVAPGACAVAAQAEGYVPRGPVAVSGDEVTTVVLRRAATLLGDVVDAHGRPVDGAMIEVVGTDLDGLPIDVKPMSMSFSAALLARARSGHGRALLPIGELGVVPGPVPPIPHGAVPVAPQAKGEDPWVTRFDGTFRAAPVPPGRLRAVVRHPAYVEAISSPVAVEPGGEGRVKVVLSPGGRLTGRVRDEKGFPVGGAWVEVAARAGSLARRVRAASDGTYVLVAVPGDVAVSVAPPDRPNEIALRVDALVPEGGTKELDLVLPAPRPPSKVRVLDDRRYPLKGAQVTVASLDPKAPVKATSFSDDKGEVEIPRVAGLRVQLEVRAPGFAPYRTVHESLAASLDVELAQGIAVRGSVLSPGGRVAASGATVSLIGDFGVRRAVTDAKGRYAFADVPRGDATIDVRLSGTAGARRAVAVAPSGSKAEIEVDRLELGAAGIVEGTVVDEKGRGVAGARVARDRAPTYVPAGGTLPGVAITDATGSFKLVDVAVGDAEIEAYAVDVGRGRVEHVRVDEGRTTSGVKIVLSPVAKGADTDLAPGGVAATLGEVEGRVVVAAVAPGSEAERGGLLEGDEIVAIDGVAVTTTTSARARLSGPLGVDVIVVVRRKGAEKSLRIAREPTKK